MTYAHLGAEQAQDVCTLCARCHAGVHLLAQRGGSLYPKRVMEARRGPGIGARKISALDAPCPLCGATPGNPCRKPDGLTRGYEHKERRVADQQRRAEQGTARRRGKAKKAARKRRMTVAQAEQIERAREAEFPLDAVRRRRLAG